jgi:hypothetical protein
MHNIKRPSQDDMIESIFWWIIVFFTLWFAFCYSKSDRKQKSNINYRSTSNESVLLFSLFDNLALPKKLTVEEIRSYPGLSALSDEEAIEKIEGLYKLSILTYKIYTHGA